MARRIVTARDQVEMLSPWRVAEQQMFPGMPEPKPVDLPASRTAMPWYHVSPHDLPEGTVLTPSGGRSVWDDVSYEQGGKAGLPDDLVPGPKISDYVWLDNDQETSDFRREQYQELHGQPAYQYEVDTEHEPEDFNGEYAVPRATIIRRAAADGIRYAHLVEAEVAEDLRKLGALSDENRVSVAEQVMERSGLAGRSFHIPSADIAQARDAGRVTPYGEPDVRGLQRDHSAEAEGFVNGILQNQGWDENPRIRVEPNHWNLREPGSGQAFTDSANMIGLAGEHTNAMTLLHETAHILTKTPHAPGGHGPEFQRAVHGLYHQHLGPEAAETFAGIAFPDQHQARLAAVNQDLVDRLHGEFMDWASTDGIRYAHRTAEAGQQLHRGLHLRLDDFGLDQNDPDLAHKLLPALPTQTGRHWTDEPEVAKNYAQNTMDRDQETDYFHPDHSMAVVLHGDWDGQGQDTDYDSGAFGNDPDEWPDDRETTLSPDSRVQVHSVSLMNPNRWGEWQTFPVTPRTHTASRTAMPSLYRGLEHEFDPDRPATPIGAPDGYSHWTDNPEIARQWAGPEGHVYNYDLPEEAAGSKWINENPDGKTPLYFDNGSLMGQPGGPELKGREYLVYNDHDDYDPTQIKPYNEAV